MCRGHLVKPRDTCVNTHFLNQWRDWPSAGRLAILLTGWRRWVPADHKSLEIKQTESINPCMPIKFHLLDPRTLRRLTADRNKWLQSILLFYITLGWHIIRKSGYCYVLVHHCKEDVCENPSFLSSSTSVSLGIVNHVKWGQLLRWYSIQQAEFIMGAQGNYCISNSPLSYHYRTHWCCNDDILWCIVQPRLHCSYLQRPTLRKERSS